MQYLAPDAVKRAKGIRVAIFDVDGTMTEGRRWYMPDGTELKAFHSFDTEALKMLHMARIQVGVMTTGELPGHDDRVKEWCLKHVMLDANKKGRAFRSLLRRARLKAHQVAYVGDDIVDVPALRQCGFAAVPCGSPEHVRRQAHYVTSALAGHGAVREVCEFILQAQGKLQSVLRRYGD